MAFKERGIKFDAIAGTSVGTLNAVLWATGSMSAGEALWRNLRYRTTYIPRSRVLRHVGRPVATLLAMPYIVARIFWYALHGLPTPAGRSPAVLLALLQCFPTIALWRAGSLTFDRRSVPFWLSLLMASGFGAASVLARGLLAGPLYLYAPGLQAGVAAVLTAEHWLGQRASLWLTGVLAIATILLPFLAHRVVRGAFSERISVLDASPLRWSLDAILSTNPISVPVYATVVRQELFDPRDEAFVSPISIAGLGMLANFNWALDYVRLDGIATSEAAQLCAASAALPFGIVPPIRVDNRLCIDGGVVDNTPIYPLLSQSLDEIFVVGMKSYPDDATAREGMKLTAVQIRSHAARLRDQEDRRDKRASTNYSLAESQLAVSSDCRLFYPRRPLNPGLLGSLYSDTLNLTPSTAREWMERGRMDTLARLDSLDAITATGRWSVIRRLANNDARGSSS
jgi:hypothetical protein